MSSLGEKLRAAREARGVTISEIADQTRVSSYYLEAIESNDYRVLPGGIFNKGFVKAFAKYVGVDEQEALQDYAKLIAEQGDTASDSHAKVYKPEVLTGGGGSMFPTLIFAAVILGLMTWGILAALNWWQNQKTEQAANTSKPSNVSPSASPTANSNGNSNTVNGNPASAEIPSTAGGLTIQFKSNSTEAVKPNITATVDGVGESFTFQDTEPKVYTPQQSIKVTISKWQVQNLQLSINGKAITLPSQPLNPAKKNGIDFEINKSNIGAILQAGAITAESVAVAPAAANTNVANANLPKR